VKRDEALLKVRQAENGLRLARMNLCQIVGLPLLTQLTPNGPSPSPSLAGREADTSDYQGDLVTTPLPSREGQGESPEEPEMGLLSQRPEVQLLDMKSKLAEEKVRLERSEFLPQIGLLAGYNYLYGLKVNDHQLLDGGNFGALLNVSIPLYHFGEGRNKVRAAQMEAEQARVEQQDLMLCSNWTSPPIVWHKLPRISELHRRAMPLGWKHSPTCLKHRHFISSLSPDRSKHVVKFPSPPPAIARPQDRI